MDNPLLNAAFDLAWMLFQRTLQRSVELGKMRFASSSAMLFASAAVGEPPSDDQGCNRSNHLTDTERTWHIFPWTFESHLSCGPRRSPKFVHDYLSARIPLERHEELVSWARRLRRVSESNALPVAHTQTRVSLSKLVLYIRPFQAPSSPVKQHFHRGLSPSVQLTGPEEYILEASTPIRLRTEISPSLRMEVQDISVLICILLVRKIPI
ncbi:hypothetical protein F4780DRAFT_250810 [Xylariomycetidae sp. FL0641]|nr:hypothetical protein F4780DRAFT_250810 [Xylariomycetidae sp. FL0641]